MYIENREWTAREIASRIDHTVLAPDTTREMIEKACALARTYGFKAVFTNPYWSPAVAELLEGSGVAAGISAAFPLGSVSTASKVAEVLDAVQRIGDRPCAVDMVTNLSLLKEKRYDTYTRDIKAVVAAVAGSGIIVKAILETSLLTEDEIRAACGCAAEAGVNYAKTSTGRAGPPKLTDIRVMRAALPPEIGVKFSGFGTHNAPELAFLAFTLGADVLGSPQGDVLVEALTGRYAGLHASVAPGN